MKSANDFESGGYEGLGIGSPSIQLYHDGIEDCCLAGLLQQRVQGHDVETPPFPIHAFEDSPAVYNLIEEVAHVEGVSRSLIGIACLGALSTACGAGLAVRTLRDWVSKPNLYIMPFGDSGAGKSLVERHSHRVLRDLDQGMSQGWKAKGPKLKVDEQIIKDEMRRIRRSNDATVLHQEEYQQLLVLQERLDEIGIARCQEPTIFVEDFTPEKLAVVLQSNDETMSVLSSDGRVVIDNMIRKPALYLKGWSGDSHKEGRISRSGAILNRPCLSMLVFAQPDKLEELMAKERSFEAGLIPRLLIARSEASQRRLSGVKVPQVHGDVKVAYDDLMASLAREYLLSRKAPRIIECELDALELWRAFHDLCVDFQNALSGDFRPLVRRWAEQSTRIAINLHAARHGVEAHNHRLDRSTMKCAIELTCWFCIQQMDVVSSRFAQREEDRVKRLVNLLKSKPGRRETMRALGKNHSFGEDELERMVRSNPSLLRIDIVQPGAGSKGGRPSRVIRLQHPWEDR